MTQLRSTRTSASTRLLISALGIALLISMGGLSTPAQAQEEVSQNVINQPCTACNPNDVHASDVDGDGKTDILSASESKIAWHKNLGGGSFSDQRSIITEEVFFTSVYATDLDGDGDPDILSASKWDGKIAWYENDGSGDFSQQKVLTTDAVGARSVYAADLDGDGDTDVISASDALNPSKGEDEIAWYENEGNGTFSDQKIVSTNVDGVRSVHATDLDGDDDVDILSASRGGSPKIVWYENTGGGSFASQKVIASDPAFSVISVDLDGDGDVDILTGSRGDNGVAWYENVENGTFSEANALTTNEGVRSVFAADVDGDGDRDVLFASDDGDNDDDKIAWHENSGDGSFSDQKVISTVVGGAEAVYAVDLSGNGKADAISASSIDDKIAWYEYRQEADNNFGPQQTVNTLPNANRATSVYAEDLDGDGDDDVLSASAFDDKIAWYENVDDGSFSDQNVITTQAKRASMVFAKDLDNDGNIDVLSASREDDKIAWYENDGSGSFSSQKIITTNAKRAASVYASDLDADGDQDVVSAFPSGGVAWYENNGNGGFSDEKMIETRGAWAVFAADLDEDGDKDVLAGFLGDDKVAWYENDGTGSFSDQKVITINASSVASVYAADLDGDGDMDVLSAGKSEIYWYENYGDGLFSGAKLISDDIDVGKSVYAADLDGDEDADVLSASGVGRPFNDKIAWYENMDEGFSDQRVVNTDARRATSVYATDLDEDGDPDVLSASSRDDKIAWYENTSSTLPVDLAKFNGQVTKDNLVIMTWKTANEQNNAGFEVQRKEETGWNQMGYVESKAEGGTTTEAKSYQFTAGDISVGTHQFRLKQVDLDGSSQVHGPISVDVKMQEALKLKAPAPNPVSSKATLSFAVKEKSNATVTVYDILGRKAATLFDGRPTPGESTRLRLDASELPSGSYMIRLRADGQTRTQRMTVVR